MFLVSKIFIRYLINAYVKGQNFNCIVPAMQNLLGHSLKKKPPNQFSGRPF